jgi:hypothetical protein
MTLMTLTPWGRTLEARSRPIGHRPPDHKPSASLLARAAWVACPACRQTGREVLIRATAAVDEDAVRRRIQHVAARAAFTQPERRVVSVERQGDVLEVLSTSQKLAHRIAHELTLM